MRTPDVDFQEIERQLEDVLENLGPELSPAERLEVVTFIAAGEYGIALETLCSLIAEESKRVSKAVFQQMVSLSDTMGIREGVITDEFIGRVLAE